MHSPNEKSRLNVSSVTTSDPSNHSCQGKLLKKPYKNNPKNTPRTSSSSSLIKNIQSPVRIALPLDLSPERVQEITSFRKKKIQEYRKVLESCLSESLLVSDK